MDSYMWAVLWLAFAQPTPATTPLTDTGWDQPKPLMSEPRSFTMPVSTGMPAAYPSSVARPAQQSGNRGSDRLVDGAGVLGSTDLTGVGTARIQWWNESQPIGPYASIDPMSTILPEVVAVPAPNAFSWGLAGLGLLALGRLITANRRRSGRVY